MWVVVAECGGRSSILEALPSPWLGDPGPAPILPGPVSSSRDAYTSLGWHEDRGEYQGEAPAQRLAYERPPWRLVLSFFFLPPPPPGAMGSPLRWAHFPISFPNDLFQNTNNALLDSWMWSTCYNLEDILQPLLAAGSSASPRISALGSLCCSFMRPVRHDYVSHEAE